MSICDAITASLVGEVIKNDFYGSLVIENNSRRSRTSFQQQKTFQFSLCTIILEWNYWESNSRHGKLGRARTLPFNFFFGPILVMTSQKDRSYFFELKTKRTNSAKLLTVCGRFMYASRSLGLRTDKYLSF